MTQTLTTGKYLNNEGAVTAFFRHDYDRGYAYGENNSNVFFAGDTLYSYGTHFPMAVRHGAHYFVNADSYSSSTAKHQSYVQRHCPTTCKIEIPFSALERAGILVKDIEVLEKESSKYVEVEKRVDGEMQLVPVHLMGSTLFKANGNYYISGIDETAKDLWKGFFLTQLVGEPETVAEAYNCMKPEFIQMLDAKEVPYKRQGEYFFSEVTNEETLKILKGMEKQKTVESKVALLHENHDQNINSWQFRDSRHVVTKYAKIGSVQFAKGTCRHVAGEHKMLKLDGWHLVSENVQVQSWSSNGRVD